VQELGKGDNYAGVVVDEAPVEVHKAKEGLELLDGCQSWPIYDGLNFAGVHRYSIG
jgi:hypothetical protein